MRIHWLVYYVIDNLMDSFISEVYWWNRCSHSLHIRQSRGNFLVHNFLVRNFLVHNFLVHNFLVRNFLVHNFLVHNFLVHNFLVRNFLVHNFLVHNFLVHNFLVHNFLVHNFLVHNFLVHKTNSQTLTFVDPCIIAQFVNKNPTRCKNVSNFLLFRIYMNLNMFRATHRPSSGA